MSYHSTPFSVASFARIAAVVWERRARRRQPSVEPFETQTPAEEIQSLVAERFDEMPEPHRSAAAVLHWYGPPHQEGPVPLELLEEFLAVCAAWPSRHEKRAGTSMAEAGLAFGCGWQRRSITLGEPWRAVWGQAHHELAQMLLPHIRCGLREMTRLIPAFSTALELIEDDADFSSRLFLMAGMAAELIAGTREPPPGGRCRKIGALHGWKPRDSNLPGYLVTALLGDTATSRDGAARFAAEACFKALLPELLRIENAVLGDCHAAPQPKLGYSGQVAIRECSSCGRSRPRPMLAPSILHQHCAYCGGDAFCVRSEARLFVPHLTATRRYRKYGEDPEALYMPEGTHPPRGAGKRSQRPSNLIVFDPTGWMIAVQEWTTTSEAGSDDAEKDDPAEPAPL